jgi:hypothetical protein
VRETITRVCECVRSRAHMRVCAWQSYININHQTFADEFLLSCDPHSYKNRFKQNANSLCGCSQALA